MDGFERAHAVSHVETSQDCDARRIAGTDFFGDGVHQLIDFAGDLD